MKRSFPKIGAVAAATLFALSIQSCQRVEDPVKINSDINLASQSVNPSLVKTLSGFENLQITTLISSDDKLPQSPNFVYGGQPDGAGLLKDLSSDGGTC